MPFSYLLKRFREEKGLSLRELGDLAVIDHAYLLRLERRQKAKPSKEVVGKLSRALELTDRDALLLDFVGQFLSWLDTGMIEYFLGHPEVAQMDLSWAMGLRYRVELAKQAAYPVLFSGARSTMRFAEDYFKREKGA